jgi:hypothetical protein
MAQHSFRAGAVVADHIILSEAAQLRAAAATNLQLASRSKSIKRVQISVRA